MKRAIRSQRPVTPALLAGALLVFGGCSDDNGGDASFNVVAIGEQIDAMVTIAGLNDAFMSLQGLGASISPVMGPSTPVPSIVPVGSAIDSDGSGYRALSFRMGSPPQATLAANVASGFLSAPLGVTCIWTGPSGWGGGSDLFGPVPADATFFELYELDPGTGLPLDNAVPLPNGPFTSVRPGSQDPASSLDVNMFVQESGAKTFEATTTGTVNGPGDFDIAINDGMLAGGGDILDFRFTARASSTAAEVFDIVLTQDDLVLAIDVSDNVTGGTVDVTMAALCDACGDQGADNLVVEFSLDDATNAIISGDVIINDEIVANITGNLLFPTVQVLADSPMDANQEAVVEDILASLPLLVDNFLGAASFGACVGSGSSQFCEEG